MVENIAEFINYNSSTGGIQYMTNDKLLLIANIQSMLYDCNDETLNAIYTLIKNVKGRCASDGLRKSYLRIIEESRSESSSTNI